MAPAKTTPASKKKVTSKDHAHPPFLDMIKECITAHPDEARDGVSRPTIKKYIEDTYKLEISNAVTTNINKAITRGADTGDLVLPKGLSGKVKLPPKRARHDEAKENKKPVSKTLVAAKKPAKAASSARTSNRAAPKTAIKAAPKTASKPAAKTGTKMTSKTTTKVSVKPSTVKKSAPATKAKAVPAKKPAAKADTKTTTSTTKKPAAKPAAKIAAAKVAATKKVATKAPVKKAITGTTKAQVSVAKAKVSPAKKSAAPKRKAPTARN